MPANDTASPKIIRKVPELRSTVRAWKRDGKRIALVPTMGALHEGHLSLVRLAREHSDKVIVSIFVNPTQFAPHEDFDAYPRDEKADIRKLSRVGVDMVYAPDAQGMYGADFSTAVEVSGITEGLCGATRPHFFRGVATVVTKLLLQVLPDVAVFGEKDFQQVHVIRRLVRDLDIPVDIIAGPIMREKDGLAISSRNQYLSPAERAVAARLNEIMGRVAQRLIEGEDIAQALDEGRAALWLAGFDPVDYLELRNSQTLAPMTVLTGPAQLLAAAWVGKTRLIDNRPVRA